MIIVVANYKGGVGKTTIAINLAHAFKGSIKTYIVDFDPQKSLSVFEELYSKFDFDAKAKKIEFLSKEDYQKGKFEAKSVVIVDTPPYFIENFKVVFKDADYVILPTKTGLFDIANIAHILDAVGESTKIGILLNMVKPSTNLTSDAIIALKEFETDNVKVLNTQLSNRVSYIRSILQSNGIYESGDAKAKSEFESLIKEILIKITH